MPVEEMPILHQFWTTGDPYANVSVRNRTKLYKHMKALVLEEFNSPYKLKDINKPVPQNGQVLVKIKASAVNPLDLKICALKHDTTNGKVVVDIG